METEKEIEEPKIPKPRCKNCDKKLAKQGLFCPSCGQRDFDGRVKMRDLLAKFFANLTHLDNKFMQMCWHLLVPARVSLNYFQGKIKRYPHPVQFFFIVMFFFLLMFGKQLGNAGFNPTGGNFSVEMGKKDEKSAGEKLLSEAGLFVTLEHNVALKDYRTAYDHLPDTLRKPIVKQALDTILRRVDGPWEDALKEMAKKVHEADSTKNESRDSLTLNFVFSSVRIGTEDLVKLSADSIIQKYGLKDWGQKITIRQGIKAIKDPKGLIHRYVGSFAWALLFQIAFMAFALRLLYWKKGAYYVEHFIFLMHQQSGAFLLLTLALVIQSYLFPLGLGWIVIIAWIGISLLIAMKRFYGEKWGWTLIKWLLFCGIYLFALIVLFIATLLVAFIVF